MVLFFLWYVSNAGWMMIFLVSITMLIGVTFALMPVAILVRSRDAGAPVEPAQPAGAKRAQPAADKAAMTAEVTAEFAASDEFATSAEFEQSGEFIQSGEFVQTGEFETSGEFVQTGEFETSSEFEMSADDLLEDSEAFELEDDDEPKKR